jgi:hypothetical protein
MSRIPRSQQSLTDKEVVSLFVDYLARNGNPGLTVNAWPDEGNRLSSDIDTIAGPFAIEHSSVDTVPNQRRDSAWFLKVVKELEDELGCKLPFRLVLTFPYEGVQRGQRWSKIAAALRAWILNEAPKLAIGSYTIGNIPEIPFEFHATKRKSDRTGLLFGRFAPHIKMLPGRLREQLDRKAGKLSRYKDEGKTTILLVESDDVALMNDSIMWGSLREAYHSGPPRGVDQVWFADTSIREEILFTDMTKAMTS